MSPVNFFLIFMFHVCLYYVLSVPCSLVITCWERADLLAILCVIFPCVFVTFLYGVSGQVWYLIVSIAGLCLLIYFDQMFFCLHRENPVFGICNHNQPAQLLRFARILHGASWITVISS